VRATLQSAFELPGLADQAFSTWVTLLKCIGEEDILSLIDETFAITVQNWTSFSPSTQKLAHDTIEDLIKGHNENIRDRIEMIPSLAGIELLEKIDGEIKRFKSAVDPLLRIDAFCRRCQDENSDLVRQGLQELVLFLIANQKLLHESTIGQQPNASISQLYRVLLDASLRFKETHADILNLCGQCLGILGSVDPNKMEAVREKRELLMLSNFDRATEVIDFVAYMLESVIVPAFHAAASGKAQTYLAYVMQELLKTCGFKQAVLSRQRPSDLDPAYRRWIRIPETIRFTLMPYLNSKYFVLNPSNSLEQTKFPIFNSQLSHGSWLRSVVFSLLLRPNSENTRIIFPVLSRVIWGHDIAIAASLLPFVIRSAVVGGSETDVADVLSEIQAVLLNYNISELETPEADNVKQCSEVSKAQLIHLKPS
jgi:serine/threonine-protein kinase ATR